MTLSNSNLAVISCSKKGYIAIDNKFFNSKGKELKLRFVDGYPAISHRLNGKGINMKIHKFVAYQKFGDKIFEKNTVVRHLNGNKLDFSLSNIEIGTPSQNKLDEPVEKRKDIAYRSNLLKRKLTKNQADEIRKEFLSSKKQRGFLKKLSIKYNVANWIIRDILRNRTYFR